MNIVTQLITFFALSLLLNQLNLILLIMFMLLILAILIWCKNHTYFRLLKRLKWVFIATILVFIFNTPGEHVAGWPFSISPSYEGLIAACSQLLRLALILAMISHILETNTRERLIAGLYCLLQPLQFFKLDVRRFAARLWLTLYYVDIAQNQPKPSQNKLYKVGLFDQFEGITSKQSILNDTETLEIELDLPYFGWLDCFTLLIIAVLFMIFLVGKLI